MAQRKRVLDADEYDRPTSWLNPCFAHPDFREYFEMGLISYSLEGLVRFDTNKGSIQHVEMTERALAEALVRLSDRRMDKEYMMFALQAVAQALFGLEEDGYRLDLIQNRRGRPRQLPDRRRKARRQAAIVKTVEQAEALGQSAASKRAAKIHGCSPATVKRAKKAIKAL
ncbi:MAG: hypothetical protein ACOYO0_00845 [Sandarakinorhabdus sp.]